MNILMILLLPMAAHSDLPCPQGMTNTTEFQMVVADAHASDGKGSVRLAADRDGQDLSGTGVFDTGGPAQANYAGNDAAAGSDDLLFYVALHAQAVSISSGPTMTPWLELRPIGYVERHALQAAGESTPLNDEHACARSAAHAPAPGSAALRSDLKLRSDLELRSDLKLRSDI